MIFCGEKKFLKKTEVRPIVKILGFKSLATQKVLNEFPDHGLALSYLPDCTDASKLERTYVLAVI